MCSTLATSAESPCDERAVQRNNLFLLSRLAIRCLLEKGMAKDDRRVTIEDAQLVNFFIIFEKVLRHGVRGSAIWKQEAQDAWQMLRRVGTLSKEMQETVTCVEELPNADTYACRLRAWLRLAVMQNKLADYVTLITDAKSIIDNFYEEWALLRHESTAIPFAGSLLGLRALRCDLYLKEQNLKAQPAEMDLSLLIKLPSFALEDQDQCDDDFNRIDPYVKSLLDQTSYLEERNALLQARNEALQSQVHRPEQRSIDPHISEGVRYSTSRSEELEVAMTLLETDVHQKQDTICSLREQVQELKNINIDLYKQLRAAEGAKREKEFLVSQLTDRYASMERRCRESSEESASNIDRLEKLLNESRSSLQTFETELERSTGLSRELQTLLQEATASGQSLQTQVDSLRKENEMMREKLDILTDTEQKNRELRNKCSAMAKQMVEYEKALEEVGVHLSQSKLKVEDLKEGLLPFVDARWEDDKNVTECQRCHQKFSVSRRKHHCRHCGGIFCNQCSENTLPLPSSAKPARVCDGCFSLLLERLTSKMGTPPPAAESSSTS